MLSYLDEIMRIHRMHFTKEYTNGKDIPENSSRKNSRMEEKIMNENVYWIVELAVEDGELDNFRSLMKEMVDATRANEPGTLNYEWSISEDSKTIHIYERYADSAAAVTHMNTFGKKFAERFLAAVDQTRFAVYGNPNNEAKTVLTGVGAVFMTPFGGFSR